MNIKPYSYYKDYYTYRNLGYSIIYTDGKMVYEIAYTLYVNGENILCKHDITLDIGTVEECKQKNLNTNLLKEISKEDLFLELL